MLRRLIPIFLVSGLSLGCATQLPAPLRLGDIQILERSSEGRSGSAIRTDLLLGAGHSFSFSPTEVSFVSHEGDLQRLSLDSPLTLEFESRAAGAKKGFLIGSLAFAGGLLITLLEIDGKDTGEMEALPLVLGGAGIVGGAVGAVIGAVVGGVLRFEIGGS